MCICIYVYIYMYIYIYRVWRVVGGGECWCIGAFGSDGGYWMVTQIFGPPGPSSGDARVTVTPIF